MSRYQSENINIIIRNYRYGLTTQTGSINRAKCTIHPEKAIACYTMAPIPGFQSFQSYKHLWAIKLALFFIAGGRCIVTVPRSSIRDSTRIKRAVECGAIWGMLKTKNRHEKRKKQQRNSRKKEIRVHNPNTDGIEPMTRIAQVAPLFNRGTLYPFGVLEVVYSLSSFLPERQVNWGG